MPSLNDIPQAIRDEVAAAIEPVTFALAATDVAVERFVDYGHTVYPNSAGFGRAEDQLRRIAERDEPGTAPAVVFARGTFNFGDIAPVLMAHGWGSVTGMGSRSTVWSYQNRGPSELVMEHPRRLQMGGIRVVGGNIVGKRKNGASANCLTVYDLDFHTDASRKIDKPALTVDGCELFMATHGLASYGYRCLLRLSGGHGASSNTMSGWHLGGWHQCDHAESAVEIVGNVNDGLAERIWLGSNCRTGVVFAEGPNAIPERNIVRIRPEGGAPVTAGKGSKKPWGNAVTDLGGRVLYSHDADAGGPE